MVKKRVKKRLGKNNFYLPIISCLKKTTNLSKIQKELSLSKQQLNYYLRQLKRKGFVFNRDRGWWELTEKGKNPTKYGIFLKEDMVRGHAYIWETEIEKIPENWDKRIELLKQKKINHILVGALKTTPRIKLLGRKVWLCKDHLRIFDIEKESYYGNNAKESRQQSKLMAMRVIRACESKLGIKLNPNTIKFKKDHYALIRNQLAIDQNQKGIVWRIKDEEGEWLLIDDSLEEGGELETVGKKSFKTNPKLQKFWNSMKEDNFKTADPNNLKQKFNEIDLNLNETVDRIVKTSQLMIDSEMRWKQLETRLRSQEELIYQLVEVIKNDRNKRD
jgi:predicted transcriptional regulator